MAVSVEGGKVAGFAGTLGPMDSNRPSTVRITPARSQPPCFPICILQALSFIIFICYIASTAAAFMMVPLLTFLLALCFFVSYSLKLDEKFRGICCLLADFLCGIIAAIIYFAISIAAVSKYSDTASKAAGVFGFIATIVYCVYVYFTFNSLATFLKQGDSSDTPQPQKSENDDSDSDSN